MRTLADKEVVLTAVRSDGYALKYCAEALQADRDVVTEAVANNGAALYYAHHSLKRDVDIALVAVRHEGAGALPYVDARLRYGPDIRRAAQQGRIGSPPPMRPRAGDASTRASESESGGAGGRARRTSRDSSNRTPSR